MKVLVILAFEDVSGGDSGATALVEMPEGMSEDDVFVAWWRKKHPQLASRTREVILEGLYKWHVLELEKLEE